MPALYTFWYVCCALYARWVTPLFSHIQTLATSTTVSTKEVPKEPPAEEKPAAAAATENGAATTEAAAETEKAEAK